MIGFEVYINGTKKSTGGLETGVLTCILTYQNTLKEDDKRDENCEVVLGGLDTTSGLHYEWLTEDLAVGDAITIKVINTVKPDEPKKVSEEISDELLITRKLNYYYKLKEELKDFLKE